MEQLLILGYIIFVNMVVLDTCSTFAMNTFDYNLFTPLVVYECVIIPKPRHIQVQK